jgi:hypothetical protein
MANKTLRHNIQQHSCKLVLSSKRTSPRLLQLPEGAGVVKQEDIPKAAATA